MHSELRQHLLALLLLRMLERPGSRAVSLVVAPNAVTTHLCEWTSAARAQQVHALWNGFLTPQSVLSASRPLQ